MTEIYNGPPLDSEELQGLSGANREVLLELYKRRDALDKAIKEIEANHKRNKHQPFDKNFNDTASLPAFFHACLLSRKRCRTMVERMLKIRIMTNKTSAAHNKAAS